MAQINNLKIISGTSKVGHARRTSGTSMESLEHLILHKRLSNYQKNFPIYFQCTHQTTQWLFIASVKAHSTSPRRLKLIGYRMLYFLTACMNKYIAGKDAKRGILLDGEVTTDMESAFYRDTVARKYAKFFQSTLHHNNGYFLQVCVPSTVQFPCARLISIAQTAQTTLTVLGVICHFRHQLTPTFQSPTLSFAPDVIKVWWLRAVILFFAFYCTRIIDDISRQSCL